MLPHNDLVLTVPMSADNLIDVLGPGQITHLAACSNCNTVSAMLYNTDSADVCNTVSANLCNTVSADMVQATLQQ